MKPSEMLRVEINQLEKDIQKLVDDFDEKNGNLKLRVNIDNVNACGNLGRVMASSNRVTVEVSF